MLSRNLSAERAEVPGDFFFVEAQGFGQLHGAAGAGEIPTMGSIVIKDGKISGGQSGQKKGDFFDFDTDFKQTWVGGNQPKETDQEHERYSVEGFLRGERLFLGGGDDVEGPETGPCYCQ